jgi:SAM-dependent methyltransferase
MIAAVSPSRWHVAQSAEQRYWDRVCSDEREFARILREKVDAAAWAAEQFPGGLPQGDWVEIGIGPLGVGCIHLLRGNGARALVGVEPLPLIPEEAIELPAALGAVVLSCRNDRYRHHQAPGEATGLEVNCFNFAFCYNVLDHVRDPAALLAETHRILAPGGRLVLGCDVVSALSLLKFHAYVRRRFPGELGVLAHTFRFRGTDLRSLVEQAGFRIVAESRGPREWIREIVGHAQRILLVAEKDRRA